MGKIMTNTQFIKKLKEIASLPTTYYSVAGGSWAKWNGNSWNFDCVILIKAILWGWNGDKTASHGGAKYASNGVYDDNANQILKRCSNVSTDFSKIEAGELVWLDGHVGVYIGNGQVIECTAAWEGKVLYSTIDSKGRRIRNGRQVYSWKKHGKLNYIEYVKEEATTKPPTTTSTTNKFKKGDKVVLNGYLYRDSKGNGRGQYKKNYKGTITIVADGSKPYHIGSIGWVAGSDIKLQSNATTKITYKTITNCTWLNLRTSASYGNNIYKAVKKGTKVEYLGLSNGWAKVKYENKTLYCGKNYLK